jgi:hypothetical protein
MKPLLHPPFGIFNIGDELSDNTKRILNISDLPLTWSAKRVRSDVNIYTPDGGLDLKLQLVLTSMIRLGINHLSKTGINECYRRMKIYEHLVGATARNSHGEPIYITKDIIGKYKNLRIEGRRAVSKSRFRQLIEVWVTITVKKQLERQYTALI